MTFNLFGFSRQLTHSPQRNSHLLPGGIGRGRFLPPEPDLVGMVPEVVTLTNVGGGVSEEPLPKAELPEGWVPSEMVTHVWFCFILVMF